MITAFVIVFTITALSVYDAIAYTIHGYEVTITAVVRRWDSENPTCGKLAMLAIGLLIGHLFL